jgi:hypothetical protein
MKGRTAVTVTEIVDQAWQADRARQQQAAEEIAARLGPRHDLATPHDATGPVPGTYRVRWTLAA